MPYQPPEHELKGAAVSAVPRSPFPKAWPESAALVALSEEVKSLRIAAIGLRLSTHYKKPSTEGPLPPYSANPASQELPKPIAVPIESTFHETMPTTMPATPFARRRRQARLGKFDPDRIRGHHAHASRTGCVTRN